MARASSISTLPIEVQKWLDNALVENNFSDYQGLEGYLKDKGFDISRSAIHRYGQEFEKRLQAIRDSTKAAEMVVKAAEDQGEKRSEAVIALVQTDVFNLINSLNEVKNTNTAAGEKQQAKRIKMLTDIAHAMASLSRASVNLRRYQNDLKEKIDKKLNELSDNAVSNGIDIATLERIKREVYGLL